jgi:hypothetical protein
MGKGSALDDLFERAARVCADAADLREQTVALRQLSALERDLRLVSRQLSAAIGLGFTTTESGLRQLILEADDIAPPR